jgi:hypothetical protein
MQLINRQLVEQPHFPGDAGDTQAIGPIGRQAYFDDLVIQYQVIANIRSHRRIRRQFHQAVGGIRKAQFLFRAQHAPGFHTAQLGLLDLEIPRQYRTHHCQRRLETGPGIGCAAHDLHRFATGVHLADA